MSRFCVETITPEKKLRPQHGVLHLSSLSITSDARLAAEQIVQEARNEAEMILQSARNEAQQKIEEQQQQTLKQADALLQALESAYGSFLEGAQDIVLDLIQALFDRLLAEMPPRERMVAMLARLASEVPSKPVNAVLRVHPEDGDSLPDVEWEVKHDAAVPRGTCRLDASNGEWSVDFNAAVSALKLALMGAKEGTPVADSL